MKVGPQWHLPAPTELNAVSPEVPPTPESLREFARTLQNIKDNLDAATAIAAGFALANPVGGGTAAVALAAASFAVDHYARQIETQAKRLERAHPAAPGTGTAIPGAPAAGAGLGAMSKFGGGADAFDGIREAFRGIDDASLVIEAAGQHLAEAALRLDQISTHLSEALGDMFGALEPPPWESDPDGRLIPASFPGAGDDRGGRGAIARLENASQAGRGLADTLARIEQAGQAVGEVLAVDDARLAEVAESLDRAAGNVGGFGDSMTELKDVSERTFGRIKEVLVDFTETGKLEWRDLARVALDAAGDMLASVAASAGGGPGGFAGVMEGIVAALGGLFGGPREHGGPVAPGQAFLVGEAGPELFVPPAMGEIVPAHALGGLGGGAAPAVAITQNFDFKGASLEAVGLLRREANRIKHELMAEILDSARRGGALARMPRI